MKRAINHKGYALIDILQNCVTFNKLNTFTWYNSRVYELDDNYDTGNLEKAMALAQELGERIPIGVLYETQLPTYHENHKSLQQGQVLAGRRNDPSLIEGFMREMV
jgi:2-oxoglutarate ferredoxin oxidoreductase subunit beta